MILEDGMLLYHGSYAAVEEINLSMCAPGKDFGRGFYVTSDRDQAHSFLRSSLIKAKSHGVIPEDQSHGYVSVFRFNEQGLSLPVHIFEEADKEWLWFIAQNRRKRLAKELEPLIDKSIRSSEIIIGKVANDTTNPVITTYLNGLYGDVTSDRAVTIAIEQLMPDHLKDQYCFLSQRAAECLHFQETIEYDI